MTTPDDSTCDISAIDELIAAYMEAADSGTPPDREAWIASHPGQADRLRAFFADLDRMDAVASPLRIESDDTAAEPTGPAPATLRYFGDYELMGEIARGGMGVVYLARQTTLKRPVALKMILAGVLATSRDVRRFRVEAEAAANLDHPGIVPIYEVGEHDGRQYFTMKLVDGPSLDRRKRATIREEVEGLLQVARAIEHAHRRGVLHRDLKPSNVLVDRDGTRLVTDFGLAKRLSEGGADLTETGQLLGTPRYMAPEQAEGRRDLTTAVDVHALGALLYERIAGRPAIPGDNVAQVLLDVRTRNPPRPSTFDARVGRDLDVIAAKCLEKDPSRRYASAETLAEDLGNWLAGRPINARAVGPIGRAWRWGRRNPAVASLLAALAGSLVVGSAVALALALRLDARAGEALVTATRSQILAIQADSARIASEDKTSQISAFLRYADAFELASRHADTAALRRFIAADMALLAQEDRRLLPALEGLERLVTEKIVYSDDGRLAAASCTDGVVRLWDNLSGRLTASIPCEVGGLVLSPDRSAFVTYATRSNSIEGGRVRAWSGPDGPGWVPRLVGESHATLRRIPTGEILQSWPRYPSLASVAFAPDSRRMVGRVDQDATAVSAESRLCGVLIDLESGNELRRVADCNWIEFTPDGRLVLAAVRSDGGEAIRVIDGVDGTERFSIPGEIRESSNGYHIWDRPIALSRSGDELAILRGDDRVDFVSARDGRTLPGHLQLSERSNFACLEYGPGDRYLILTREEFDEYSRMGIYARAAGEMVVEGSFERPLFRAGSSPYVASWDGSLFDLKTGVMDPGARSGRFHPLLREVARDGRFLWQVETPGNRSRGAWDLSVELPHMAKSWRVRHVTDCIGGCLIDGGWNDDWAFLPTAEISDDPEVVRLWAEVHSVAELGTGSIMESLTEDEWQRRRRRLLDRLKPSDSPLLWTVARDESAWLRGRFESIYDGRFHDTYSREGRDECQEILSRLCATAPTIGRYERLARWHFLEGHREEAAEAYLSARRLAGGDWYWRFSPARVLDQETEGLLYLASDREARLRAYPPKVAEVAGHRLGNLESDPESEFELLERAVRRGDLPADAYTRAGRRWSAFEHAPQERSKFEKDREATSAWALFRVGRYQEALDRIVATEAWKDRPDLAVPPDDEIGSDREEQNSDRVMVRLDLLGLMAMAEFRLGHHQEARASLDLARRHRDYLVSVDTRIREAGHGVLHCVEADFENLQEAERLIGPAEIPDDPFAPE